MDNERRSQQNRLHNREKSDASKLAWKRHRGDYMRGVRKREREQMNKSFLDIAKELDERINENKIVRDNVFELELDMSFDTVSGGMSMSINDKTNTISFSCSLEETGSGAYSVETADDMKALYNNIKEDFQNLCQSFDEEMKQIIAKHGLKSTK